MTTTTTSNNTTEHVVSWSASVSAVSEFVFMVIFLCILFLSGFRLRRTRNSADLDRIGAMQLREKCAWRTYANRSSRKGEKQREGAKERARAHDLSCNSTQRERERASLSAGTQDCVWVECDAHPLPHRCWAYRLRESIRFVTYQIPGSSIKFTSSFVSNLWPVKV